MTEGENWFAEKIDEEMKAVGYKRMEVQSTDVTKYWIEVSLDGGGWLTVDVYAYKSSKNVAVWLYYSSEEAKNAAALLAVKKAHLPDNVATVLADCYREAAEKMSTAAVKLGELALTVV